MPLLVDTLFLWPLFIAAVLFDIFFGEYPVAFHPVVWMGRFIGKLVGVAERRNSRAALFLHGAGIVVSGLIPIVFVAVLITFLYNNSDSYIIIRIAAGLITAFLIKSSFSLTGLMRAAGSIMRALDDGDIKEARIRTSMHLVSRDTSSLDGHELSAAVIESVAENLTDSIIAPWIFLLLGGPAAAVSYRFVNTCDSMIGYRNEKYEWLGKFAARTDDVLNFIPARLAAFFIAVAAGFGRGVSGVGAFRTMFRDHRLTESPNAGWTMAAAAGALGVRLEKKGCYILNAGGELPVPYDIKKTIGLIRGAVIASVFTGLLLILLLSGVLI